MIGRNKDIILFVYISPFVSHIIAELYEDDLLVVHHLLYFIIISSFFSSSYFPLLLPTLSINLRWAGVSTFGIRRDFPTRLSFPL